MGMIRKHVSFSGAGALFLSVLLAGCTAVVRAPPGEPAAPPAAPVLTPARDLTGNWQGMARWRDNVGNPACTYDGTITFNLQQDGNALAGLWQVEITQVRQLLPGVPCAPGGIQPPAALAGTVSSSTFRFSSGEPEIVFTGGYTSDLLNGEFESCPGQCPGGTVGSIGTFSATREQ
jgi:hypothetical protein